jgi:cobalt/nickel transport system permease protein
MYPGRLTLNNDILKNCDARCRLAAGIVFIMAVVRLSVLHVLFGVILALFFALVRDRKAVIIRMAHVNLFCLMLFITMPLGGESISRALVYTLRINASALAYMFFIIPMKTGVLASAFLTLKVPPKLAALFVLSHRYLFVMYERVFVSLLSMRLRCPSRGTLAVWRAYTAVFSSALASAVVRSKKVSTAMRLRGFDGSFPITGVFRWKLKDSMVLAAVMIVSVSLLIADTRLRWNR